MKKLIAALLLLSLIGSVAGCARKEEKWDLVPMVRVNGTTYLDTGVRSSEEDGAGAPDGRIISTVNAHEVPTENDQSNFGEGYEYRFGGEGVVEVRLADGKWYVFATEEARRTIQFPDRLPYIPQFDAGVTEITVHSGGETVTLTDEGDIAAIILAAENITLGDKADGNTPGGISMTLTFKTESDGFCVMTFPCFSVAFDGAEPEAYYISAIDGEDPCKYLAALIGDMTDKP